MYLLKYLNDEKRVQIGIVENNKIYPLDTTDNLYQLIMHSLTLKIDFITFSVYTLLYFMTIPEAFLKKTFSNSLKREGHH